MFTDADWKSLMPASHGFPRPPVLAKRQHSHKDPSANAQALPWLHRVSRETMENRRKMVVYHGILWDLPSGKTYKWDTSLGGLVGKKPRKSDASQNLQDKQTNMHAEKKTHILDDKQPAEQWKSQLLPSSWQSVIFDLLCVRFYMHTYIHIYIHIHTHMYI